MLKMHAPPRVTFKSYLQKSLLPAFLANASKAKTPFTFGRGTGTFSFSLTARNSKREKEGTGIVNKKLQ